ncbi:MAG: neutral zinc metallopeptidase [Acidimicrobiales bacterium]|nr:neutral zinc metallopeptidase [Acidimicrobiales bacterium]
MAHEYSHAVQSQVDAAGSRLELELQADCFAGAWAATQATTGVDLYRVVTALTLSADPADTTVSAAAAHGNGYERTAAFVHGHREGAVGCLEHPGSPTESPPGA